MANTDDMIRKAIDRVEELIAFYGDAPPTRDELIPLRADLNTALDRLDQDLEDARQRGIEASHDGSW